MTDPDEANRQFELGDEYSTQGARAMQEGETAVSERYFRQAIDAYQAALDVAPDVDVLLVSNLRLCIGARWQGLGDVDRALEYHEDALAQLIVHPEIYEGGEATDLFAQARLNRADCWLAMGKLPEARLEVEDVMTVAPEHPYATYMLERIEMAEENAGLEPDRDA